MSLSRSSCAVYVAADVVDEPVHLVPEAVALPRVENGVPAVLVVANSCAAALEHRPGPFATNLYELYHVICKPQVEYTNISRNSFLLGMWSNKSDAAPIFASESV